MAAQQYEGAFDEIHDDPYKPNGQPRSQPAIPVLSQATFLKGFVPPSYLVDGVLQRAFI